MLVLIVVVFFFGQAILILKGLFDLKEKPKPKKFKYKIEDAFGVKYKAYIPSEDEELLLDGKETEGYYD